MASSDRNDGFRMDAALGYSLLRVTVGVDFLLHSFTRWGDLQHFVNGVVTEFAHTPLPVWPVRAFAWAIPFWEPLAGLLITLGLWTRAGLVAASVLMIFLVFGTSLLGQFAVLEIQLVYAFILFVLLWLRSAHDRFGVDGWRSGKLSRTVE